jgi:polyisoprenoid-binding protein YceI
MALNLKPTRWLMAAMLPLLLGARGTGIAASAMDPLPESRIWVGGTSPVRGWECRATTFGVTVESSPNAAATVLAGEKAVASVDLAIPIEKLECGNGQMNGHMRKALKAQEHPQIAFKLSSYELTRSGDSLMVTMAGSLTIGGTEKPIELAALATAAPDGALRVAGTYQLKMTEFGLKPPTLMFGTMKVHDLVKVGFDVLLKDRAE